MSLPISSVTGRANSSLWARIKAAASVTTRALRKRRFPPRLEADHSGFERRLELFSG